MWVLGNQVASDDGAQICPMLAQVKTLNQDLKTRGVIWHLGSESCWNGGENEGQKEPETKVAQSRGVRLRLSQMVQKS